VNTSTPLPKAEAETAAPTKAITSVRFLINSFVVFMAFSVPSRRKLCQDHGRSLSKLLAGITQRYYVSFRWFYKLFIGILKLSIFSRMARLSPAPAGPASSV
jgi:hypothetical protein